MSGHCPAAADIDAPRDDALSPFRDATHSDPHTRSEFCATCHNLPVERTFDEWRDSPYSAVGVSCQDCHVTPGPGMTPTAGRSAMLRSAATIEFAGAPAEIAPGAPLDVRVKVTNAGAGHKLPTGFAEGREVWIDFKVLDAAGTVLYESGAIEDGHAAKRTHSFKAVLGDPQGNVVDLEVWKADRILADTRILPKGSAVEEYTFTPAPGTQGPLTLQADLLYASFSRELLGPGKPESQVVELGSVRQALRIAAATASRADANAGAGTTADAAPVGPH